MEDEFVILIADRNRHVREFLEREFAAEGYRVICAGDAREVLEKISGEPSLDLAILDLEIPYTEGLSLLERIQNRRPPLPLVIHSFITEATDIWKEKPVASFVEKSGNIEYLKLAVLELLQKFYPERFPTGPSESPVPKGSS